CRGEREKRERMDTELGSSFDDGAAGFGASPMSGRAWQAARSSPATVAIRDDGDVEGRSRSYRRSVENVLQDYMLNGHGDSFSAAESLDKLLCYTKYRGKFFILR